MGTKAVLEHALKSMEVGQRIEIMSLGTYEKTSENGFVSAFGTECSLIELVELYEA